ncbi:cupin domain-containing protein [Pseudohoeflea suaedae]|uniref:Cupin domain-containing protein n=1 Tax=Pseudohoeflea suaedae TaxID=877384 RepID=A0A4R5PJ01_9HYPH|nr:cupin domain-containing protein [Pseudohoeflea suaedae]TDH34820.1 cupin domain-containing protein [Pseudohoeflea suaedae]
MRFDAGLTPEAIIATLGMSPHPEGGHYVETFRDTSGGGRGASTAIYYLLKAGERSHWHRVTDASEVWHWHAGGSLKLSLAAPGGPAESHVLGIELAKGQRPQIVVPANCWQSAEPMDTWTLVGCTVAPGFAFSSFEMAPPGWTPPSG